MNEGKITIVRFVTRRPNVSKNWPIFNAPRPICGVETWEGEFHHGRFYAAVDINDSLAEMMLSIEKNGHGVTLTKTKNTNVSIANMSLSLSFRSISIVKPCKASWMPLIKPILII